MKCCKKWSSAHVSNSSRFAGSFHPHRPSRLVHSRPSAFRPSDARPSNSDWQASGAALLSALVVLTSSNAAYAGDVLAGPARVVDGDTLYVQGKKIRLYGVDAPEKAQLCKDGRNSDYECGQSSLQELTKLLEGQFVACDVKTIDMYGRNVAACSVQQGKQVQDVGSWLVSNGYAVAYRQYSKDYIPLEEAAQAARKGIWQGSFEMPAHWRKDQKAGRGGSTTAPSSPAAQVLMAAVPRQAPAGAAVTPVSSGSSSAGSALCGNSLSPIKGNISSKKEKIYHVPGGALYDKVKIDLEDGERYFCSEQEAQAAGWRASAR